MLKNTEGTGCSRFLPLAETMNDGKQKEQ